MKLAELQDRFGRALLHGNDSALAGLLRNDGIHPDSLLRIYRDSAFASLTSVLSGVFAAVRWLLGDETFRRTAEGFIRAYPPTQPCLDEYGERFAEFLVQFDASRQRPYLPDLAQLEWLVRRAEQAPELVPLSAAAFRRAIREDPTTLLVRLDPSIGWLKSQFPVDIIWSASLRKSAIQDLGRDQQSICIEVRCREGCVSLQRLDNPVHAFRVAIGSGASVAIAGELAKSLKPDFAVLPALAELLRSGTVVSFSREC